MAEYAGLEIRIGGNTTKLNNALKASTKSAAELQSRIRQVTRAMQFDPTNLKNVETRVKLTGDRMESLQSKAQLVRTAMKQLGDTMVKFRGDDKSIRDIATETDNLSLAAKQADERYAKLTGSLAEVYEAWNNAARNNGVDFAKKLKIDQKTAERLMSASTSLRDFRSQLDDINRLRATDFSGELGAIITPQQLGTLQKFKELNFHDMFKRGLDLDEVVASARDMGVAISDSAVANVRDLQRAFNEAATEKEAFDKALQFDQMGTDLQRIDSEAESLSQTIRRLDDDMSDIKGSDLFQRTEADIRKVDAALDLVEKDLERTEAAMEMDPKNIQLAARYMQDLQQKAELGEEKATLLNKEMQLLKSNGAKRAAEDHADLARWIEESAENARVAKKELSDQQATVANLEDAAKTASQAFATMKKDFTLAEMSDNVQDLTRKTDELATKTEKLASEQDKLDSNTNAYNDLKSQYDEASEKADTLTKSIHELNEEQKRLSDVIENSPDMDEAYEALNRLGEITPALREMSDELRDAEKSMRELSPSLDDARERMEISQSTVDQYTEDVEKLNEQIDRLSKTKEVRLLKDPGKEIEREKAEVEKLEAELKEARAEEKRRQDAYDSAAAENNLAKEAKAFKDVEQQVEETKNKVVEAQDAMVSKSASLLQPSTLKSLGMTFSATVSPFLAGIGTSMLDATTDIDSAYRDMRKTVEGTEDQFESLRKHAIEYSKTHVTSADQILEIEAIGGELGVATENLTAFAEAISNIDVATNLDVEGASEALGHLANIMHLGAEDYEGFSNALVRLGNNGASTESEIANIAERIGSMGSIVNMSASDVLAWASSIASTGQNAEAAGTAISRTMSFFETAVAAAGGSLDTSFEAVGEAVQKGGDDLVVFANLAGRSADEFAEAWDEDPKAAFEELSGYVDGAKSSLQGIADIAHMSADEFASTWESDPTAAMKAFIEGLNDVEASGGSADAVLQGLGITAVRQKQAIEGLMQTVVGLDNNLKMSEDAWNGFSDKWGRAGDAANEAAKKAEGFSGQIEIFKNIWHGALTELGEGAAPWIQRATGWLGTLTDVFSGMSSGAKETIVALGGIAFATGPVLTLVSTLGTAWGNVKSWAAESITGLTLLQDSYKKLGAEAFQSLNGMSYGMASAKLVAKSLGSAILKAFAIGAAIAAVVALGVALKNLYDQYQDHIAATKGLKDAIASIGTEASVSAGSTELVGSRLRDLAADSRGYESRLADLAHTIEDSNSQYSTYAGTLTYYGDTVKDLAGKESRTKEESAKLAAALEGINEACGTNYAIDEFGNIIDTQTGQIQDNTDAILANLDARRASALMEYYSDDYAKAVGEFQEATDKLKEAQDAYDSLSSDEGKAEYFAHAKEVYGSNYDESKVQAAYNKELEDGATAIANYRIEADQAGKALSTLEGKMDVAQAELNDANRTLDEAAEAEEQYKRRTDTVTADVTGNMKKLSDAVTEVGGTDADFNDMADGLAAISVSAKELNGVNMSSLASAFDATNGSMQQVIQTLADGGVELSSWNAALEAAPGAAENMASITSSAFQSMYEIAGQDLNDTMLLIAGLQTVEVGDKTFYVGDNGSIMDSLGRIYDVKTDLDSLPPEVLALINVDAGDAESKIGATEDGLNGLDGRKASVGLYANDYASSKITSVKEELNKLNGRTVRSDIYVYTHEKQATGGMNGRPVIPKHATGYIATGPTLTNQGWIGEDGVEAVANWATGGAVVPLTNKRYMLPIADAIAEGMSQRLGGGGGATYNTYINDAVVNGDAEIQAAVVALLSTLQRKGAMNRG